MADPPPADTPAASTRDRNVIADTLAIDRDGASLADAAAALFADDYHTLVNESDGRLASMVASPAREAVPVLAPAGVSHQPSGASLSSQYG